MALQRDHQNTHGSLTRLSVFQGPKHPSSLRLVKTKRMDRSMANSLCDFERIFAYAECNTCEQTVSKIKRPSMRKGLRYSPGLKNIQPTVLLLTHNIHTKFKPESSQQKLLNKCLPSNPQTETTSSTRRCHQLPSFDPNNSAFSAAFLAASARGNNSPGSSEAKVAPAMDALSRCYIQSLPQP